MPKIRMSSWRHKPAVTAEDAISMAASLSNGILHIGAHRGQESSSYARLEKPVIWIEAIPDIARSLSEKLRNVPSQISYQACLSDSDDDQIEFNVSSNDGQSSSILPFGKAVTGKHGPYRNLKLETTTRVALKTQTLDSFIHNIDASVCQFNHWVIDVQGAELLVLKGARRSLQDCRSLVVETSTLELYQDGATFREVEGFLNARGFRALWSCHGHMDVLFIRDRA